jgi:putative NADH-flavin reductase
LAVFSTFAPNREQVPSSSKGTFCLGEFLMHIALYGATGKSGSRILTELLTRGHQVTAIVRDPAKLASQTGLTVVQGDLVSVEGIAGKIKGADAVVSAYAPPPDDTGQLLPVTGRIIDAVKQAGVPRLLIVGGAGSLEVAPGVTVISSGHVPAEWLPIAVSHAKLLDQVKQSDINWTYFSPAGFFVPGERTGKFRLGTDQLIANEQGDSRISLEDYAIALVDELESPKHERERFTIGY